MITNTLHLTPDVEIELHKSWVTVKGIPVSEGQRMLLRPDSREEANRMAIALKMAAKRMEETSLPSHFNVGKK